MFLLTGINFLETVSMIIGIFPLIFFVLEVFQHYILNLVEAPKQQHVALQLCLWFPSWFFDNDLWLKRKKSRFWFT